MHQSSVTLPPLVDGPIRGHLKLEVGPIAWLDGCAPPGLDGALQARITWWGDDTGGEVLPLPSGGIGGGCTAGDAAASVVFELHTGPKYLIRYLHDMGSVDLAVEAVPADGQQLAAVATASVDLLALDVCAPLSGRHPLVLSSSSGVVDVRTRPSTVGSLYVRLELDYGTGGSGEGGCGSINGKATALLSSFEFNEHLAGTAAGACSDEEHSAALDDARPALAAPLVCTELSAALRDRELVAMVCEQAYDTAAAGSLQQVVVAQTLPLLLPHATKGQLGYAAAMLNPFHDSQKLLANPSMRFIELEAAAAACSDVECRLQQQRAADATRVLRELVAALGSRSLELAAAFAAAAQQQLAIADLGTLLRRLHPSTSAEAARCMLAMLAAGVSCHNANGTVTLPAIKAVLAEVLEAQQFPTEADLEKQQLAAASRKAKESAAAAATVMAEQRAASAVAVAARAPLAGQLQGSERKAALVSRLKSTQQQRRRSSSGGGAPSSEQSETLAAAAWAEEAPAAQPPPPWQAPAVAVGLPVLPVPGLPAAEPEAATTNQTTHQLAATLQPPPGEPGEPGAAPLPADAALPHADGPRQQAHLETGAAAGALSAEKADGQAVAPPVLIERGPARGLGVAMQPDQPHNPLLDLIQQAEQLKAALQQAAGTGSMAMGVGGQSAPFLAGVAAGRTAGAPRLPNLLLAPQASSAVASSTASCTAGLVRSLQSANVGLQAPAKPLRLSPANGVLPQHNADSRHTGLSAGACQPGIQEAAQAAQSAARPSDPAAAAAAAAATTAIAAGAAAAAIPAIAAGAAPAACDVSDDSAGSDAEDALLASLFPPQRRQPAGHAWDAAPALGAAAAAAAASSPEQQPRYVLHVQLQPLVQQHPAGAGADSTAVCVLKPLSRDGEAQRLTLSAAVWGVEGAAASECSASAAIHGSILLPAVADAAALNAQPGGGAGQLPPCMFLEFWRHSGGLLGVAQVPLLQPKTCGGPTGPAVVAAGRFSVRDVLQGGEAGSLHVAAVLQDRSLPRHAAAIRHCFTLHLRSAHRLPSAAAYAGAGLRAPDSRVLSYSFPGDPEVLHTNEVACCTNPSFDATAKHELVLPAARSILPLLQDGLLRFDLFDCWADCADGEGGVRRQQHGWALLPLSQLAALAQSTLGGGGGGSSGDASRTLLLPLCTEYDCSAEAALAAAAQAPGGSGWGFPVPAAGAPAAAAAAARGPSLKVELCYSSQLCTVDAAEAAAAEPATVSGAQPATAATAKQAAAHGGGSSGGNGSDSDGENRRAAANGSPACRSALRRRRPAPSAAPSPTHANWSAKAWSRTADGDAAAGSACEPAEPSVPATLAVEVVRACGLATAVRAAIAASTSAEAASSLSRAAAVGPHAFARLALPDDGSELQAQAPPLQTPFVAQSFSPVWQALHSYRLQLTGRSLDALASQTVRVEVWHRCSRAAAAVLGGQREVLLGVGRAPLLDVLRKPQGLSCWVPLSAPGSSGASSANSSANSSSSDSSSSDSSSTVGAVQIAVRLTELAGVLAGSGSPEGQAGQQQEPLLLRSLPASALLPHSLRTQLLLPPGAGFEGQAAVLAVRLDLLLPPLSISSTARPKADRYFCAYTLPGSSGGGPVTTAARLLTTVAGAGSAAAWTMSSSGGSGRGGGRGRKLPPSQLPAGQEQQWGVNLEHLGYFQVSAGPQLVAALLHTPLLVSVYKQAASGSTSCKVTATATGTGTSKQALPASARPGVLVGTAEVDLSPLLWTTTGTGSSASAASGNSSGGHLCDGSTAAQQQQRRLSGRFALVDATAASQGAASLAAAAQLQLVPSRSAAQQAAAAAAAGADVCCALWPRGDTAEVVQGGAVDAGGNGGFTKGGSGSGGSVRAEPQHQLVPLQQQPHGDGLLHRQQHQQLQQNGERELRARPQPGLAWSSDDEEEDEEDAQLLQRCDELLARREPLLAAAEQQPRQQQEQHTAQQRGGCHHQQQQVTGGGEELPFNAAAGGHEQEQGRGSATQTQEQQGQQGQQQPGQQQQAGGSSSATGAAQPYTEQSELQLWRPDATAGTTDQEGSLLVHVDTAVHLPPATPSSGASGPGANDGNCRVLVRAALGRQPPGRCTPAVQVTEAAGLGGTAVWDTEVELAADAALWAASRGAEPALMLQIWRLPAEAEAGAAAGRDDNGASGDGDNGGNPTTALETLLGTAAVDLRLLPAQGCLSGWFPVSHPDRHPLCGQLKATVRASAALRRLLAHRSPDLPINQQASPPFTAPSPSLSPSAGTTVVAAAAAAASAAPSATQRRQQEEESGMDLMERLHCQLAELELLSQRLAAPHTAVAAYGSPRCRSRHAAPGGRQAAASAPRQQPEQHAAAAGATVFQLAESDGEEDGWPTLDARQLGHAWSGTDSDEGGMALLGVALEGAVSPGFSDQEEEAAEEEHRPRSRGPALLLSDDWMFGCSKAADAGVVPPDGDTTGVRAAWAAGAVGTAGDDSAAADLAPQRRRPVVFQNVIPSRSVLAPGSASTATPPVAAAPACPSPPPPNQLPVEAGGLQGAVPQAAAAPEQAMHFAALEEMGGGRGAAKHQPHPQLPLPSFDPGWMFEIRRPQQAAASSAAVQAAAADCEQFAPMQEGQQGAAVAEQQRQVQQVQQPGLRPGSAAAAATIDEVLEQLRPRGTAPDP